MINVKDITKLTDTRFVNLYDAHGFNSKGHESHYNVASRADSIESKYYSVLLAIYSAL